MKRGDELEELIGEAEASRPGSRQRIEELADLFLVQHSLAERRRALGISQAELARRVGTSRSALARIENGTTDCRISTLQRIALALGGKVDLSFSAPPIKDAA